MTYQVAQTVVAVGQSVPHRYVDGRVKDGSFTIVGKQNGELKIRNHKGNPRTVKVQDWDETLAGLNSLRNGSGQISRQTMKTRNSTYVLGLIGLWEDRGHKF